MILSHGYAASLARQRNVAAQTKAVAQDKAEAVSSSVRRERERWEWFSKPQHDDEFWVPTHEAQKERQPRLVLALIPRHMPMRLDLSRAAMLRDSVCGGAHFEAVPMAWEAPNGQLVRWFDWRPVGYDPIHIREYERKQYMAQAEARSRAKQRRGILR